MSQKTVQQEPPKIWSGGVTMRMRVGKEIPAIILAATLLTAIWSCGNNDVASHQEIGPFTEGMAPVRSNQKWGFIDLSGNLVIPAEYVDVKPFSDGLAAGQVTGRWRFLDTEGKQPFDRDFFRVENFSEGLAAVKDHVRSSWGYINKVGKTVIPAQFESALPFNNGLAPVEKDGEWRYIREDGTEAFVTQFHRAYPFSEDGLALVRAEQNGKHGYISEDGSLKIPTIYDEALPFTDGLAAVRVDKKWGYIDTEGMFAIQPAYDSASIFSENMASIMEGDQFHYISADGQRVISTSFDFAAPFSNGLALVLDNGNYWYINPLGHDAGVAQARKRPVLTTISDADCEDYESIHNAFNAGFVRFKMANVGDQGWNITSKKTWEDNSCANLDRQYDALPGFPERLEKAGADSGDYRSSFVHFVPGYCGFDNQSSPPQSTPLFDITLTSDDGNTILTLGSNLFYKPPPPPTETPFWDFLLDGMDIIASVADMADGNVFWAVYDFSAGTYDLISDASGSADNTMPEGDGTHFITTLTGTINNEELNPWDGSFCGGDEYTVGDGESLIVEMSAARSKSIPGEVNLVIYPFDSFYALRIANRLNGFRKGVSSEYLQTPYDNLLKRVFQNYNQVSDDGLCENEDGSQGYLPALENFSTNDLLDFFNVANNFDTMCGKGEFQTNCDPFVGKLPFSCGN